MSVCVEEKVGHICTHTITVCVGVWVGVGVGVIYSLIGTSLTF